MPVIPCPGTKVAVAWTSSDAGGSPAFPSALESAIEKQEAWAAAINSSGLVLPPWASERAFQSTANGPDAPEVSVVVPAPVIRSPSQWVDAVESSAMVVPFIS